MTANDRTNPSTCITNSGTGNISATNLPAAEIAELTTKETSSRKPQPRITASAVDRCLIISLTPPDFTGKSQMTLTEAFSSPATELAPKISVQKSDDRGNDARRWLAGAFDHFLDGLSALRTHHVIQLADDCPCAACLPKTSRLRRSAESTAARATAACSTLARSPNCGLARSSLNSVQHLSRISLT